MYSMGTVIHTVFSSVFYTDLHMHVASVKPLSSKAKNRFCNLMSRNPVCIVEQDHGDRLFLTSANRGNHFWVDRMGDPDWLVQFPKRHMGQS